MLLFARYRPTRLYQEPRSRRKGWQLGDASAGTRETGLQALPLELQNTNTNTNTDAETHTLFSKSPSFVRQRNTINILKR